MSRTGIVCTHADGDACLIAALAEPGHDRGMCRWNAYRGVAPAWSDVNLRDLAAHIESPLFPARYSSEHRSRTLFVSEHVDALRKLHPDNPRLQRFTEEDRVVVSEPPGSLPGAWLEVPESTAIIIQQGADEQLPFQPHWP
jgi:hypothetical protein